METPGESHVVSMGLLRPGEEADASPLDFFEWGSPTERPEGSLCFFELASPDNVNFPVELIAISKFDRNKSRIKSFVNEIRTQKD